MIYACDDAWELCHNLCRFFCKSMLEMHRNLFRIFVLTNARFVMWCTQKCVSCCTQKNVSWREAHLAECTEPVGCRVELWGQKSRKRAFRWNGRIYATIPGILLRSFKVWWGFIAYNFAWKVEWNMTDHKCGEQWCKMQLRRPFWSSLPPVGIIHPKFRHHFPHITFPSIAFSQDRTHCHIQ